MKKNYIIDVYREKDEHHAGTKVCEDFNEILAMDYEVIFLNKSKVLLFKIIEMIITLFRLKLYAKNIIVYQPVYAKVSINNFLFLLKNINKTAIIFDLSIIRYESFKNKANKTVDYLNQYDGIVSQNNEMTKYLRSIGVVSKISEIGVWDYLYDNERISKMTSEYQNSLCYVSNLMSSKSGFIYDLISFKREYSIYTYGPNFIEKFSNYDGAFWGSM
ncbi:MAG: hypothetical protein R3Y24_06960 [Eubacteriales bacterium]